MPPSLIESRWDIAGAVLFVVIAVVMLVRRFTVAKKPPSCAPEAGATPQVILGANLARGLKTVQKERKQ